MIKGKKTACTRAKRESFHKKTEQKLHWRKDETFSFLCWPDFHFIGDCVCREWRVLVRRKRTKNLWRYALRERESERKIFLSWFRVGFYPSQDLFHFHHFYFFWCSLLLTMSFFFIRFYLHEQQRSNHRLDSVDDYEHRMARRDGSFVSKWGRTRRSTWETNSSQSDEQKCLSLNNQTNKRRRKRERKRGKFRE